LSRKLYRLEGPLEEDVLGFRKGYLRGYKEGYERGYKEGFNKGFKELYEIKEQWENDLQEYVEELSLLVSGLKEEKERFQEAYEEAVESYKRQVEEELAEVVAMAAGNYLNRALEQDTSLITGILEKCLQRFSGDFPLEIHVDERFVGEVEKFLQSTEMLSKNLKSVQIVKDNRIGFGVLIDSEEGRVDARVETLTRNLRTLVESSLHDNPEDQLHKG